MQLHEEESKIDNVMDWLVDDPEFKELLRGLSEEHMCVLVKKFSL